MEEDPRVEEVKEIFTLKRLQERVFRLESENKELKVRNSILDSQYKSQEETQSDILRTLYGNIEEYLASIEKSEKEIQSLQRLLENQKQEFKDKLEEERAQCQNKLSELQTNCEKLQRELVEVKEFRANKETLEANLASLKQQLADQAEAHARDVSAFDRKKAMDIDQLKKNMERSIKETRDMLKAKTKDQLDSTTKHTIMENEQFATELHFQSKETERLLDRNQMLLEENAQLRRNLLIHKDLENELARRTHVYQKLLKKMDQKLKVESASAEQSRTLHSEGSEDQGSFGHPDELAASNAALQEEADKLHKQVESLQSTLQTVRHEFAQYRRDHSTLAQLQDQSTRLIVSALYELKNQRENETFPPPSYDENASWQFATMTGRQKEYFFRVLLEKLNSSMCGNCFPAGPQQMVSSTTSLPPVGKGSQHDHTGGAAHFSQFLWSVATHGGPSSSSKKEVAHKGAQTETMSTDPCFKEGMWSPASRAQHTASALVTPSIVCGSVRTWGPRSLSQKPRLGRVV